MRIVNIRKFGGIFLADGEKLMPGEVGECSDKAGKTHIEAGFARKATADDGDPVTFFAGDNSGMIGNVSKARGNEKDDHPGSAED